MTNEPVPAMNDVLLGRLRELLRAGYITRSIYQTALQSEPVALGVIAGYLDSCHTLSLYGKRRRAS